MMKMIQLGATDLQVSALAFGCMSLTREREAASKAAVWRALELGINFFDTAMEIIAYILYVYNVQLPREIGGFVY